MPKTISRSAPTALARAVVLTALAIAAAPVPVRAGGADQPTGAPPASLHETGLYLGRTLRIDPAHLGFAPQYPLWTDGAEKRRWISLPAGAVIDATDADAWDFPVGTRFWKEFSFDGTRVETRYMERLASGEWLFASYAWAPDGRGATLAPVRGMRRAHDLGDGRAHAIPGLADCAACHRGGRSEVLGFSALQLSDDRDPGALHADPPPPPGLTLRALVARGLLSGLDATLLASPPRISTRSDVQRAALGYLHANCGHCHNAHGPLAGLGLFLRQPADARRAPAIASTFRIPLHRPPPGLEEGTLWRVAPGVPRLSALPQRMAARGGALQMPPLGTVRADDAGVDLITRWIAESGMVPVSVQLSERQRR